MGDPNLISPDSEPTEEEIAEALRIMGEDCNCPTLMGTALYHHGTVDVDCPIHGEKTHQSGIDVSQWQRPIAPGDIITIMTESMSNQMDIEIMEGTIAYGDETSRLADDYGDWEDENPPRQSKSAAPKHTEDGRSVFTSFREIGKRIKNLRSRKRAKGA